MAISLKEQLSLAQYLKEAKYFAPTFDATYYKNFYSSAYAHGREQGRRMFYDFYAMEFLWSFLGSGQLPKSEREKQHSDPDDPSNDIIKGKAHRFLPHAAVKMIDDVYEQVTYATADRLIRYLRAACYQEFRYLLDSSDWKHFYKSLVSQYNVKKSLSKEEFRQVIESNIPDMVPYPDTVLRILRFQKIYNKQLGTPSNSNPIDDLDPKDNSPIEEPVADDQPELPLQPNDGEESPTDEIPGPPGGEVDPETLAASPYKTNWFKRTGNAPPSKSSYENPIATGGLEDDDEEEPLKESLINIGVMKPVYQSAMLAGMTLTDILRGYNNIEWSSSFGGKRWGMGAEALIKLIAARKSRDVETMNHVIDHIYDLQHNTGSLLNKGPMYVSEDDLNRRYKITDIARFIPFVSPMIKNLILRYHPYLRISKEQADTESNMENLMRSPVAPFTPEEIAELNKMKFVATSDGYKMNMRFLDKKKNQVGGVYYIIRKHQIGSFSDNGQFQAAEGAPSKYVVADNYKSDVKAYDTFAEAVQYLKNFERDYLPTFDYGAMQTAAQAQSQKAMYIQTHTKIRLPMDKEQELLNVNMGWSHKHKYYKAYTHNNADRILLYAFNNGMFLLTTQGSEVYQLLSDWNVTYSECKKTCGLNSVPHPQKDALQKEIDAIKAGLVNPNAPFNTNPYASSGIANKTYSLEAQFVDQLTDLVKVKLPHTPQQDFVLQTQHNGMYAVMRKKFHVSTPAFQVGKNMDSSYGKQFTVISSTHSMKLFDSWEETYNYINQNLYSLAGIKAPASVTQVAYSTGASTGELPPNASSKTAYSVHSGISKAPTQSIRLTEEDENTLMTAGFKAQMVGNNVWYTHSGTGDTVKFYPNDTAKVVFANFPSAGLTQKIEAMLAWITSKYSPTITQSPIKTGATLPSSTIGSSKGISAGIMFDSHIKAAGFLWDAVNTQYVDASNNATLKIAPNRTSVINIPGSIPENNKSFSFKDLPSLVSFLKDTYPNWHGDLKKKSNVIEPSTEPVAQKISYIPENLPKKVKDLLYKGGYKYIGIVHELNENTHAYKNDAGDEIVFFSSGAANVKDSSTNIIETYKNADELQEYLQEKFGSKPMPTILEPLAEPKQSDNEDAVSPEELASLSKLIKKNPGFKIKMGAFFEEAKASKLNEPRYIDILDGDGRNVLMIRRIKKFYQVVDVSKPNSKVISQGMSFNQALKDIKDYLDVYEPVPDTITDEQAEWIETYVTNHVEDCEVIIKDDNHIVVRNKNSKDPLFLLHKAVKGGYQVQYYMYDSESADVKWSFATFDTFSEFAADLENNLKIWTQYNSHLQQIQAFTKNEVMEKLVSSGFTKAGELQDTDKKYYFLYMNKGSAIHVRLYNGGYSEVHNNNSTQAKFHNYQGLSEYLDMLTGVALNNDDAYDKMLQKAYDFAGADWSGSSFDTKIQKSGFEWNSEYQAFINDDLHQIVSINKVGGVNVPKFYIQWADSKDQPQEKDIQGLTELWDLIGPKGSLQAVKSISPNKSQLDAVEKKIYDAGFSYYAMSGNDQVEYHNDKGIVIRINTITQASSVQIPSGSSATFNTFDELIEWLSSTGPESKKQIKPDKMTEQILNDFGFEWGKSNDFFINMNDFGNTITFYGDGHIVYSGMGKTSNFPNENMLFVYLKTLKAAGVGNLKEAFTFKQLASAMMLE